MSKHNIRCAAAGMKINFLLFVLLSPAGARILQQAKVQDIVMDDFSDGQSTAEGCHLSLFAYKDMKSNTKSETAEIPNTALWDGATEEFRKGWDRGYTLADAQNFARWLMETPSNHMTPTAFVHAVSERLGTIIDVEIKKRIEFNPR